MFDWVLKSLLKTCTLSLWILANLIVEGAGEKISKRTLKTEKYAKKVDKAIYKNANQVKLLGSWLDSLIEYNFICNLANL